MLSDINCFCSKTGNCLSFILNWTVSTEWKNLDPKWMQIWAQQKLSTGRTSLKIRSETVLPRQTMFPIWIYMDPHLIRLEQDLQRRFGCFPLDLVLGSDQKTDPCPRIFNKKVWSRTGISTSGFITLPIFTSFRIPGAFNPRGNESVKLLIWLFVTN